MNPLYLNMLINDHAIIEKALVLLERQAVRADKMNTTLVKTLLEFLWDYGEKCHNQKEEKIYFPLLLQRGLPPQGPITMMLMEHQGERDMIENLRNQIDEKLQTGILPSNFKQNVDYYLDLTKNHIWKENDILYPMGRNFITTDDENNLPDQFNNLEKETVGPDGFIRYQTLVNSLEKESEGKIDLLASLSTGLIGNMLNVLPIEVSFVDADDRVRYFNKLDMEKIFTRSLSVIGRTVQQCHPQKSVHLVNQILEEMKAGNREKASFWINFNTAFVHISYFAVRDDEGNYQGCVEMVQDIKPYRDLEGEKRLLDED